LIAGDWLIGHQEIDIVELRSLPDITVERAGVASFFCDALPEHTLWVDDKGKVHYQPFDEAKKDIWVVVEWHLNSAITALKQGAIDHARYLAGNVVGVTNNLEPRCILAACYLRQANTPALRIIKQGAIDAGYFPLTFNLLTDYYYNLIPSI
jgi:hypothetical protein